MEVWKNIPGYEGSYMVSDIGRVKSLARKIGAGKGYMSNERILSPTYDKDGYMTACLSRSRSDRRSKRIHTLVFMAFIGGERNIGHHICHKDGDRTNNKVENLYCGDVITNTIDRYTQGRTKLTIEQIRDIRTSESSNKELAIKHGVKDNYISRIRARKRYFPLCGWTAYCQYKT